MSAEIPLEVSISSPEDLPPETHVVPGIDAPPAPRSRHSARAKLLGAILIAGVSIGASTMSCLGQSFSLRQARALEGIQQQLSQIQASCPAPPTRDGSR